MFIKESIEEVNKIRLLHSIKTRETRLERATSYSQSKLLNQLGYSLSVSSLNLEPKVRNLRTGGILIKRKDKKINFNIKIIICI